MRATNRVSRIVAVSLSLMLLMSIGFISGCTSPTEEPVAAPHTQDGKPIPPEAANAPAAPGFEGGPKPKRGASPK